MEKKKNLMNTIIELLNQLQIDCGDVRGKDGEYIDYKVREISRLLKQEQTHLLDFMKDKLTKDQIRSMFVEHLARK